ncbi:unnamed protein product [Amoebophrya sp. A25]|nr:unnamed protein product [Amoebophrya sp. A25]|eukprot:GSA25T00001707001.1
MLNTISMVLLIHIRISVLITTGLPLSYMTTASRSR